jgi:hypothetical protein
MSPYPRSRTSPGMGTGAPQGCWPWAYGFGTAAGGAWDVGRLLAVLPPVML